MKPYACHNRKPFAAQTRVQDGWWGRTEGDVRTARMTTVPFRMNPDCQYTHTALGQVDARCADCRHRITPTTPENP